jgi:hypothetical protein
MRHQATDSPSFVRYSRLESFYCGTRLTTTDSGHSDQQEAINDEEEEDGMDEGALPKKFLSQRDTVLMRT